MEGRVFIISSGSQFLIWKTRSLSLMLPKCPSSSYMAWFHGASCHKALSSASHICRTLAGGVAGRAAGIPPRRVIPQCVTLPVRLRLHLHSAAQSTRSVTGSVGLIEKQCALIRAFRGAWGLD